MKWQSFTYRVLFFLVPVLLGIVLIEVIVRCIPSSVQVSSHYLEQEKEEITTLILGASQNKRAINPEFLTHKTLTVAGTRQGHKTDYYLLQDLKPQLPKLKTIVISSTYRHFESPPNPKNFWKYRSLYHYYGVNAFERPAYFKDELLFLGNPNFYTQQLKSHYLAKTPFTYNQYGFQTDTIRHRFSKLKYDPERIKETYIPTYPATDIRYLAYSASWLEKILAYCEEQQLEVVLALTPVYESYREVQDVTMIQRRDSVLNSVQQSYPQLHILDLEESPVFTVYDYMNENHLNPRGAQKFTKKLDEFLRKQ